MVRQWTRNLKDAEPTSRGSCSPPSWIEANEAIVDGEVVALDEDGRPDFSLLQERSVASGGGLVYQAFDLLYLDGRSLLDVPLEDRKRLLQSVLKEHPACASLATSTARARRSSQRPGEPARGRDRQASTLAVRARPRSTAWLKLKMRPSRSSWSGLDPGEGKARELGAVAVGVYEDGKLRFAGKVGSGFDGGPADPSRAPRGARDRRPPFDPRRRATIAVRGAVSCATSGGSGRRS
jgi:bifunctional non-homologous end joining protein LigD